MKITKSLVLKMDIVSSVMTMRLRDTCFGKYLASTGEGLLEKSSKLARMFKPRRGHCSVRASWKSSLETMITLSLSQ